MTKLALQPCPSTPCDLSRQTSGLSDAHKELIRLLAQIAVDDYLRECDAPPGAGGQQ